MEKNKVTILSTRPVGKELINEAARHNILIDEISFISTERIADKEMEEKIKQLALQNITAVFTSMNAVEAVAKFINSTTMWTIFCIGNTTKKLVENSFGSANIAGTANNADQLAEKIIEQTTIKKVYFFCGDKRREELPEKLKSNNVEIEELLVYRTIETPQVISKKYDGVLFFSPSAVQSFFSKNTISWNAQVFAIGATTAEAIKPFAQLPVIIAETPGKENLLRQVVDYFSKTQIF
ncbi:MAG: uroporphyrinogen-III synthase [Bacteroidota bacterium]|nr:uroporphyrinogen-III synthase [Bacteroidota bacterium]